MKTSLLRLRAERRDCSRSIGVYSRPFAAQICLHRRLFDDLNTIGLQADNFPWMVRQQSNSMQAKVGKNLRADAVFVLQSLLAVRGGIAAVMTEAGTGLMQVDHDAPAFPR